MKSQDKILLIEDDVNYVAIVEELLRDSDWDLVSATTLQTGLAEVEKKSI